MTDPLRSVFHDILTEEEMSYLVSYATPRLSNTRIVPFSNLSASKQDLKSGKRGKTVNKANAVSRQAFRVQEDFCDYVYSSGLDERDEMA